MLLQLIIPLIHSLNLSNSALVKNKFGHFPMKEMEELLFIYFPTSINKFHALNSIKMSNNIAFKISELLNISLFLAACSTTFEPDNKQW